MAQAFATCPSCKAAQPAAPPPAAKEIRCSKCNRVHSARIASCPYCARDSVSPGAMPRPSGSAPSFAAFEEETAAAEEQERQLGKIAGIALALVLGTLWGVSYFIHSDRLGNDGFLVLPSLLAGLVLAGVVGPLVTHWLADAEDSRAFAVRSVMLGALALAPSALSAHGFLMWMNGVGLGSSEREIECTIASKVHRVTPSTDRGWDVTYECMLDGERILGVVHTSSEPAGREGSPIRFVAAPGRVGIWVRRSDELPPRASSAR